MFRTRIWARMAAHCSSIAWWPPHDPALGWLPAPAFLPQPSDSWRSQISRGGYDQHQGKKSRVEIMVKEI